MTRRVAGVFPKRRQPAAVTVHWAAAVFQRLTKLPFGAREVGRGDGGGQVGDACADQQRGEQGGFGHGGAGSIEPEEGAAGGAHAVGRGDALIEQVAGQDEVDLVGGSADLIEGELEGGRLHFAFGLLEGGGAEAFVEGDVGKIGAEGALLFLLADNSAGALEVGGMVEEDGFTDSHDKTPTSQ